MRRARSEPDAARYPLADRVDPQRRRLLQAATAAAALAGMARLAGAAPAGGTCSIGDGAPAAGRAHCRYEELTPQMFGAVGDGVSDDTAALQAWADFICGLGGGVQVAARIDGRYRTSDTIRFAAGKQAPRLTLRTACEILPTRAVTGDCLVFEGLNYLTQVGRLKVTCPGGAIYSTRSARHGIVITASRSTWDVLEVGYTRMDAIRLQNRSGLSRINTAMIRYCGSSPMAPIGYHLTFDGRTDAGHDGHPQQTSTLRISAGDIGQLIAEEAFLTFGKPVRVHQVTAVDARAGTVTVRPWLPLGTTAGTLGVVCGAGIRLYGSDTAKCQLGLVDGLGAGIGIHQNALYPATVSNLVTQACGIGYLIGSVNAASLGGVLTSSYYEGNHVDLVCATLAEHCSHTIGEHVNLDLGKVMQISAKHRKWPQQIDSAPLNFGVKLWLHELSGYATVANPYLCDKRFGNAPTIDLHIPENYRRLFFWDARHITVLGSGGNGAPTGKVTFRVPEGHSINRGARGAPLIFPGPFRRTPNFSCVLKGGNWTVIKSD